MYTLHAMSSADVTVIHGDVPLHDQTLSFWREGCWWGHEYPERPNVRDFTCYDLRCRSCWLHAKATYLQEGDHQMITGGPQDASLKESLIEHAGLHGLTL